jgi:Transglutaminase-like superfamily
MLTVTALCLLLQQDLPSANGWENYTKPRFAAAEKARQKKDFAEALRLTDETLTFLHALPAADQQDIHQEGNILHYLAWIYCGKGDRKTALQYLSDAVDRGFSGYDQIDREHELDPLRGTSEFAAIARRAHDKYDYLHILRQAAPYTREPGTQIGFTYQEPKELKRLAEKYNVGVIAGQGSETSRVLRLMRWVHLAANHDGANSPAVGKNAADLLGYAQATGKGINCRCLAIALNDLYLLAGFRSRIVACMPKDLTDQDCHVIVTVFVPSLDKWIWMDPTFQGYMQDEKGELLSIEEVRARLIAGQPVVPAGELDWNGGKYSASSYLRYMQKNLCWFTSPIHSRSDYETGGRKGEYASLVPPGFELKEPRAKIVHDPAVFWAAPRS